MFMFRLDDMFTVVCVLALFLLLRLNGDAGEQKWNLSRRVVPQKPQTFEWIMIITWRTDQMSHQMDVLSRVRRTY